jgi:hypothetical protein
MLYWHTYVCALDTQPRRFLQPARFFDPTLNKTPAILQRTNNEATTKKQRRDEEKERLRFDLLFIAYYKQFHAGNQKNGK